MRAVSHSVRRTRTSYFLFGVPASWKPQSGLQLYEVVLQTEDGQDDEEEESVLIFEFPFPDDWIEKKASVSDLKMSDYLEDESFGLIQQEGVEEEDVFAIQQATADPLPVAAGEWQE